MHSERFTVSAEVAGQVAGCEARGGRLVAVGTTSCRSLETWHRLGRPIDGGERESTLFLHPSDPPQLPMSLLTNFHLPQSTLLMLVSAFLGRQRTLRLYETAQQEGYRFYSYGDAMLIL
jgi:S-adenosylmethionine:tRNA ribosyltransferase-isomerase